MEDLRKYWEVPAVAHFVSLFRGVFKLIDFDIEDLEEALLVDTDSAAAGGRSNLVVELLVALLKGNIGRKDVSVLNYNYFLHDLLAYRWEREGLGPNPLGPDRERASFHSLPVYAKLKIFHSLCEWRLDRPDVEPVTKNLEGDSLRVNELGRDDAGNVYWYFYGTRLYREKPKPVKIKIKPPSPKKTKQTKKEPYKPKAKKSHRRKHKSKASKKKEGKEPPVRRSSRQAIKKLTHGGPSSDEEEEEEEDTRSDNLEDEFGGESDDEGNLKRVIHSLKHSRAKKEEASELGEEDETMSEIIRNGPSISNPSSVSSVPSLLSKLKPDLLASSTPLSGRSSPNSSETGDAAGRASFMRDMIQRIYSCEDDDDDSRLSAPAPSFHSQNLANKDSGDESKDLEEREDLDKTMDMDDLEATLGDGAEPDTSSLAGGMFTEDSRFKDDCEPSLEPNDESPWKEPKEGMKVEEGEDGTLDTPEATQTCAGRTQESSVKSENDLIMTGTSTNCESAKVKKVEVVAVGPPAWSECPSLIPDPEETKLWDLVCSTLEDWKDLTQGLKDSKSKTERELYDLLENEFLPEMEKLFAQKERERQRKMAELMPRRSSGRIELRKLQRDEEQKKLAAKEKQELEKLSKKDQERMKKFEQDKREHRLRMRELEKEKTQKIKERAREERSRRLDMRKQRQALTAAGLEIPPELVNTGDSYMAEDSDNELEIEIELEHMYGQLEKVLDMLKGCTEAEPFLHPVDRAEAPDYDSKIEVRKDTFLVRTRRFQTPMDLETIENKLLEQEYKNKFEFIDDVNMVFLNSLAYNGLKSEYTRMAQKCERVFIKAMKKHFPPAEIPEGEESVVIDRLGALDRKLREALGEKIERSLPKRTPVNKNRGMDEMSAGVSPGKRRRVFDSSRPSMYPPAQRGRGRTYLDILKANRARNLTPGTSMGSLAMHDYGSLIRKSSPVGRGRGRAWGSSSSRDSDPDNPKWKIRVTSTPLAGKYNSSPGSQHKSGQPPPNKSYPVSQLGSLIRPPGSGSMSAVEQSRLSASAQTKQTGSFRGYHPPPPVAHHQPRILQGQRGSGQTQSPSQVNRDKPNVYLIPMEDGNRLVKFVDKSGQPVSSDYVNQILPQIRREAHKLPKGLVTMTLNFDSTATEAPTKIRIPENHSASVPAAGTPGVTLSRSQPPETHQPSTSCSGRYQYAAPRGQGINQQQTTGPRTVVIPSGARTAAVSHVQAPRLSIPVSQLGSPVGGGSGSPTKLYNIGSSNYLSIEDGVPFLMRKREDGTLVKVSEVSRDELVQKLNSIREQKQTGMVVARPVCSVAPQPKLHTSTAGSGVVQSAPRSTVYLQSTSQNQPPVAVVLNQNPQQKSEAVIVGGGGGAQSIPLVLSNSGGSVFQMGGGTQTLVISTSQATGSGGVLGAEGTSQSLPQHHQFQVIQVLPQIVVNPGPSSASQDPSTSSSIPVSLSSEPEQEPQNRN